MGRIAQETINRVLDEVDILEVISQYVDLKKRGKNYFGLSPFRSETKPSFSVAADKNMWYDFGSGQGGNAIQFLIEHERIGFAEAVRLLAKKYGIEIIEIGDKEQDNLYDQLYEIHELACIYFENNIKNLLAAITVISIFQNINSFFIKYGPIFFSNTDDLCASCEQGFSGI